MKKKVPKAAVHTDAAVLQTAEIQQLFHHVVQAARLIVDDLKALAVVLVCRVVQCAQGLHPAPDGGERRAQLVRDGTDELVLHLLGLFQPFGHLVDGAAQAVHLAIF